MNSLYGKKDYSVRLGRTGFSQCTVGMEKKITRLGSEGQVSLNAQLVWVKDSSLTLGMTGFSLGIREKEGRFASANLPSFSLLSRIDLVIPNPEDSG